MGKLRFISSGRLEPICKEDLPLMYQWRNDSDIILRTRQWRKLYEREHEEWFENLDFNKHLMYMIIVHNDYLEEDIKVGVCGLCYIDWVNRCAEVSILIGDKNYYRQGIATEAIKQLKVLAFEHMNFHKLYAEIYDYAESSLVLFKKCGFSEEARMKNTIYRNGLYWDSIFLSLLRKE